MAAVCDDWRRAQPYCTNWTQKLKKESAGRYHEHGRREPQPRRLPAFAEAGATSGASNEVV